MNTSLITLSIGILLTIIGVLLLVYMGYSAKKAKIDMNDEAERVRHFQRLIVLNFVGLGLGVLGLIMVFLSQVL